MILNMEEFNDKWKMEPTCQYWHTIRNRRSGQIYNVVMQLLGICFGDKVEAQYGIIFQVTTQNIHNSQNAT